MKNTLMIAFGAGIAAALLQISSVAGNPLAAILYYLSPLPILMAGLGWGLLSALVASLIAASIATYVGSIHLGIFFMVMVGLPAFWLTRLTLLSREVEPEGAANTTLEFYPPGHLLMWIAGLATVTSAIGMALIGEGSFETFRATLSTMLRDAILQLTANSAPDDADLASAVAFFTRIMPPLGAAMWTLTLAFNLWLAGRILRMSEQLSRPWPNLQQMTLPFSATLAFGAALLMVLLPDPIGFVVIIAAACLGIVHALIGLAVAHALTLGHPLRMMMLGSIYLLILFTGYAAMLLAIVGALDGLVKFRSRARTPPPGPGLSRSV